MGIQGSTNLPDYVIDDLAASSLAPEDLSIRLLDSGERAATGTPHATEGYVIPYYSLEGKILPFYRVKLFGTDTKYRQPKDSQNHIYFPKAFYSTLALGLMKGSSYVLVTEGEKKAAAATKAGFPCVGLGGVDSWRNRTILLDSDATLGEHRGKLAVKLPQGEEAQEDFQSPLAIGLQNLIDLTVARSLTLIICFDSDSDGRCSSNVQRAAATLGFELRFSGIRFDRIRQLVLPSIRELPKVGLDDFLGARGVTEFGNLVKENLERASAFPTHPNPRDYVNKRLAKGKLNRKELQNIAIAILSDLDSRGNRLRDPTGATYYFDSTTYELLSAVWPGSQNEQYQGALTKYLYREYGISAADRQLLIWLGTQFAGEAPVSEVTPQRVIAMGDVGRRDVGEADRVVYQVSDSQYIKVTADGFKLQDNGSEGILFQSDQVDALNPEKLLEEIKAQIQQPLNCWWASTLSKVRLRDKDKQRIVASLLYYMSPWLYRWRGMQLPVELVVGESGSGKSTLCELRLGILTGRPYLRNAPSDIKDWYASIGSSGGLHVTDNVQFADKQLRQKLSDEICRIVTEPDPFIEQRKYYTNADLVRIPVRCVFSVTAIQQPFVNADILQRSFILELDKSVSLLMGSDADSNVSMGIRYDSSWKTSQLESRGGREGWIAHHLIVLHRFFQLVAKKWDNNYQAKHRLINFEQSLLLMGEVFGIPSSWIPNFMSMASDYATTESDWVLTGLHEFALEHGAGKYKLKKFYTSTICEWMEEHTDFKRNDLLTNPHKLSKYIRAHKSAVYQLTGILEVGKESNKTYYQFRGLPIPRKET